MARRVRDDQNSVRVQQIYCRRYRHLVDKTQRCYGACAYDDAQTSFHRHITTAQERALLRRQISEHRRQTCDWNVAATAPVRHPRPRIAVRARHEMRTSTIGDTHGCGEVALSWTAAGKLDLDILVLEKEALISVDKYFYSVCTLLRHELEGIRR